MVVSVPPASEVPPPWCLRFRLACCLLPAPPAPVAQEGAGHLYSFTRGCVASAPRQAGGNRPFPCHPLRGTYSDGCLGLSTFQCKHLFSNLQNAISQCYCLDENNCCGGGSPGSAGRPAALSQGPVRRQPLAKQDLGSPLSTPGLGHLLLSILGQRGGVFPRGRGAPSCSSFLCYEQPASFTETQQAPTFPLATTPLEAG